MSISLLFLSSDSLGLFCCLFFISLLITIDGACCLTIAGLARSPTWPDRQ
ncbi:hypothetical protein [Roseofilum capinflatum]|uniref:Uncharacterized protein n=1 Tax=Roseofilum capinflatum BLCC-M114 TaxID=3022440 RepID=A0ABT7B5M9_9CYAN|nr:hypothetical protein [Roseofilum capinflatum]MDJ1174481.1 hypothetical protein [Roseofilum capinflatum BLCC-M114]